ncbi:MAG: DUF2066 domain-containing protein [Alphaproteobacteria bacterium]
MAGRTRRIGAALGVSAALALAVVAGPAGATEPYAAILAAGAPESAALDQVMRRLTASRDHGRLPAAAGPNVAGYIADVAPLAEGRSRVLVRADALQGLFAAFDLTFADRPSPALVVVPVYVGPGGERLLWSGPNPWLDAWQRYDGDAGLTPLLVPFADLGDVDAISTAEATVADAQALAALAARYGADGALVATYEAGGTATVSVQGPDGWRTATSLALPAGDPVPAAAVDAVVAAVDRLWVDRAIRPSFDGPTAQLDVTATYASLADWIAIRRALDESPAVESYAVPAVGGQSARVVLRHFADLAALAADLAAAGLVLDNATGGTSAGPVLRLAAATPLQPQVLAPGAGAPTPLAAAEAAAAAAMPIPALRFAP